MKPVSVCLLALALTACAAKPSAQLLASADPSSGIRQQRPAHVTADARPYELVEPLEWAELNRRVAPKEKKP
jgi:hypothetical protein